MEKRNLVEESQHAVFEPFTWENKEENYEFVMTPKAVIYNPNITSIAKLAYQILLDRQMASVNNHDESFLDEYGYYIIYQREDLAKNMSTSERTTTRALTELKEKGLIEVKKGRKGTPQIIYVCKPTYFI